MGMQPQMRGSGKGPYTPLTSPITASWGTRALRASHSATSPVVHLSPLPSLLSLLAARALAEQPPPNASERFRETFLPLGHPPLPGSLLRRPDLAAVLDVLGTSGPAAFYAGGNLTLEMVTEVSTWGAPLS